MEKELVEEKFKDIIDRFGEKKQLKTQIYKDKQGKHHVSFSVVSPKEEILDESHC